MRPIDSIQPDPAVQIHSRTERKDSAAANSGRSCAEGSIRAEFGTIYQPFIQKAQSGTPNEGKDSAAVLEAQKALEQGELDSPQAARFAAEAILRFGI